MYKSHEHIKTPPRNLIIWKYMDLWKFLDILDSKKLYLSRADFFEDKFEGRIIAKNINKLSDDDPLKVVDSFSESSLKKSTYISCWSSEQNETYPLWKIYSDYRSSIAIKSTVGDLIDSISNEDEIQYIGSIKYRNFDEVYKFNGNTFQIFFEKRNYFKFEKEVRLITELSYKNDQELLKLPLGTTINVNFKKLINEIYVAPLAKESFKNLIELKLKDTKLNVKVKFSNI